jgi:hypothetical protein
VVAILQLKKSDYPNKTSICLAIYYDTNFLVPTLNEDADTSYKCAAKVFQHTPLPPPQKKTHQKLYILANDDTVAHDPLFNHTSATEYCGDPGVSSYLIHIWEVLGLNLRLTASYYNQGFSWYPSLPPNKCLNSSLK